MQLGLNSEKNVSFKIVQKQTWGLIKKKGNLPLRFISSQVKKGTSEIGRKWIFLSMNQNSEVKQIW